MIIFFRNMSNYQYVSYLCDVDLKRLLHQRRKELGSRGDRLGFLGDR
jgi:hypothetical protein